MSGRGQGFCSGASVAPAVRGGGFGRGVHNGGRNGGRCGGSGLGMGRGLGMFRVGYDDTEHPSTATEDLKGALENRAAFLRAELARTESLLGSSAHPQDN